MIGQFSFSSEPAANDVVLHLGWDGVASIGKVVTPPWVMQVLDGQAVSARSKDEYMTLPIALSYAILITAISGARLTVSGDYSAWPERWGKMKDAGRALPVLAISH